MLKDFLKILLVVLLVSGTGCKEKDDRVPYVFVDITLYLDLGEFSDLAVPGGYLTITGGSRGIVIYRRNQDDFVAFDRHCTHDPPAGCAVDVDENSGLTTVCECCGSVFSLYDGIPIEGPAARNLVEYRTGYNATSNQLRIFN